VNKLLRAVLTDSMTYAEFTHITDAAVLDYMPVQHGAVDGNVGEFLSGAVVDSGIASDDVMLQSVYDTDDDGIVDGAEQLDDSVNTVTAAQARDHIDDTANPHATDIENLGSGTLAELNDAISDATLIDTTDARLSDSRTPLAHDLSGALHNSTTIANLNLKISDATLLSETALQAAYARLAVANTFTLMNTFEKELYLTGDTVDVATKNQTTIYLKDAVGNYLIHQPTYWNGSSFVATHNYGFGHAALQNNTGAYVNGFGYYALQDNTGAYVNGVGYYALRNNTGSNVNGVGGYALRYNTGAASNGVGAYALLYNNWADVIQIGDQSGVLTYFNVDAATEQTFANTDITGTNINIATHGFGSTGAKVNLEFGVTSGTPPTGLVNGTVYQMTIVDANNISYSGITAAGSGTFTFSKDVDYTSSIAIGNDTYPTKSYQAVFGHSTITETVLRGTMHLSDLPSTYANNAAAVSGGLVSGDMYRTGADPDVLCIVH